ncbi:TetR/AcrR family transcriptional regulator [Bosea caraganae]|uniref:TetR/AcrR family transcriptional regulator n=1 Tax=Bosea caraganae TaxID=2763117 RepID=A0A370L359_9HYPH|nr:TetR/AcrR family transcriptional regulator [Bosea caraganae]RDJ20946.1 TetR/AcrR family transcriptional regulator [Bosea caraganae]RDJ22520.1 TetR/AcrR family transcriptional regulator [Bosea caraganae]
MAKRAAERADLLPILAELFREYGFEAASLALIGERTGLGKGSLYHFFPGGKEEMANAVLDEIDGWFEREVFKPLREEADPQRAVGGMLTAVDAYFRSGRRVCLVGALALAETRSRFAERIRTYFADWNVALTGALQRAGHGAVAAAALSEEILALIQGGLVLARALDDPAVFERLLAGLRVRLGQLLPTS